MKWFNQLGQDPIGTIADWQDIGECQMIFRRNCS